MTMGSWTQAYLLPEPLRTFYGKLRKGEKPVRPWTLELKRALGVS